MYVTEWAHSSLFLYHDRACTLALSEQIIGGYGSALVVDPIDPTMFWILTDRGPIRAHACLY